MGFSQGLSGLAGAAKALEAIGNNVANAGTVGYKSQGALFADIFAAAGGASNQVGIGVQIAGVHQDFSQGGITTSANPLDLAINGGGLFRMSNAGTISYTRNGQFQLDKSGFLVNSAGLQLTGLGADSVTGAIIPGNYVPLQINNSAIPPQVTSVSQVQLNLDSRAKPPTTMTSGSLTGTAGPNLTITAGVNDILNGTVDGVTFTGVVIPPATYGSAAALAAAVQTAINNGVPPPGLSGSAAQVAVTVTPTGYIQVASKSVGLVGSTGQGSTVVMSGSGIGALGLGPAVNTGKGTATGSAAPASLVIVTGTNDTFDVAVDGAAAVTVTIPQATYTSATALATAISTALTTAVVPATASSVGGKILLTSNATATGAVVSSVAVTATAGGNTGATNAFGAAPVSVAGSTPSTTAKAAPTSLTIVAGTNDTITGFLDGTAYTATIAAGAPGFYTAATLAAAVKTAIEADANILAAGLTVTTSLSGGKIVITTDAVGAAPAVSVTGGNGAANLFFDGATAVAATDPFSPTNTQSFTSSTAQTVFDSLGNPHTLQLFFSQTSEPGTWQMFTSLDGNIPVDPATSLPYVKWPATTVSFSTAGVMKTPMPLPVSFAVATGASTPLTFNIDLTGTTQYGISFGTNQMLQDGFTSGKLAGMSVSSDGIVQGSYSNGKIRNMGQVVLANFNNLSGLQSLGGNQWAETSVSGQPIPGIPGTGNLGLVQSGATESSNVDLTSALVDMITQQRAYQASAQSIKTLDQIMQTLVNLR